MINQIRDILHRFGIDLVRYKPQYSPGNSLVKLLGNAGVNVFVDIGANTGQTGMSLINEGFKGKIISFEPLSKAFKIIKKTSSSHKNWKVVCAAVGDKNGKIEINISDNLQSSSILPMLKKHVEADPKSKFIGKEKTAIYKLDNILLTFIKPKDRIFVKIDSQGYEDKIVKGAKKSLARAQGIQLELSLTPLYKGEKNYDEMLKKLDKLGFILCQVYPGFTDPKTGQLLQMDGVFFRKNLIK